MKKICLLSGLIWTLTAFAQEGYEIKVTFKPYTNQYIYLGHYFGKTYPIVDSALLNDKSEAVFKGTQKLQGGIYLIGYPNKAGFFEILVDKEQHFSIQADTATLKTGASFTNSPDNVLFVNYQQQMGLWGREIAGLQKKLLNSPSKTDSLKINEDLKKLDNAIIKYRTDLIGQNKESLLSVLLSGMQEPVLTGNLKNPTTKKDSLAAFTYFKSHFWDGVNFWDGRLAYTPFFEDKVDKYFSQLVTPEPDSVIKELDYMLGYASINEEMTRLLLVKFVNRYLNQKYMWEDMVFVHLYERYFANKSYPWLTEQGKKVINDRANSLMANIMGTAAAEISLPDSTGKMLSLYETTAPFTIVAFWDATCGHCKEVLPKLDSFYRAKWKNEGVGIFAVSKETDGSRKDWLSFITQNHLTGWNHVFYSKAADKARIESGIPGYSQLYDVQSFPTLYLLDKDKRIVAKKLSYEQIDEVLQLKMNKPNQ